MPILRTGDRLSIRKRAEIAKVTPGIISSVERGKTSPSMAALQKTLSALDSDLATFFSGNEAVQQIPRDVLERGPCFGITAQTFQLQNLPRRLLKLRVYDTIAKKLYAEQNVSGHAPLDIGQTSHDCLCLVTPQ